MVTGRTCATASFRHADTSTDDRPEVAATQRRPLLASDFRAVTFLATAFLAAAFLTAFFTAVRLTAFLTTAFLTAFFAAVRLTAFFAAFLAACLWRFPLPHHVSLLAPRAGGVVRPQPRP